MASSFTDSFDQLGGGSPAASTQPFDDGDVGFDSYSNFAESDSVKDADADDSSYFNSHQPIPDTPSPPPPIYTSGGGFGADPAEFSPETNGPILPPPMEMQPEEGYALREWRRLNAIRLEEKEKKEKEVLSQIIEEAEEYKIEFHKKRLAACETNKATNREKEQVFLAGQEKFHAEADKNYWKSIAELIPKEVPKIDKKGKKEQEKKPSVVMIQGPKPGKPTDLSRMRQILIKLKHDTPPHLKPAPPAASTSGKDAKDAVVAAPKASGVEASPQPVAVA